MSRRAKALLPVGAAFVVYAVFVTGYMLGVRAEHRHSPNSIGEWLILGAVIFALQIIVALWRAAGEKDAA